MNWLTNGEQSGDTESGTYTLTGSGPEWTVAVPSESQRLAWSAGGKTYYLLPSEDEWYKAAFYKGGGTNAGYWTYATQTDTSPSWELSTPAGPEPGGQFGQLLQCCRRLCRDGLAGRCFGARTT